MAGRRPPFLTSPDGEPWTLETFTAGAETEVVWSVVAFLEIEQALRLDSEYYQPLYLSYAQTVSNGERLETRSSIRHPTEIKRVYEEHGIQILLAQNIRQNRLDFSTTVYMPRDVVDQIARNRLLFGDVVMTRSGANFGDAAVYKGDPHEIYACADCLIIRPKGIAGGYLSTYFNTVMGRALLTRGAYGMAQPHIAPNYLYTMRIPRLGERLEQDIDNRVVQACELEKRSQALYADAEALLLAELDLEDLTGLQASSGLAYTQSFSQAWAAGRLDAEHFLPRHQHVVDAIRRSGQWAILDEVVTFCQRGAQPVYVEDGPIKVVTSKHLGPTLLSEDLEATDEENLLAQRDAQLFENDVLLYSTGAYIGRTNYYPSPERALGSNHVTIIRATNACNPVFLSLFLNTVPGLAQTDQHARGSAQREIYPDDIKKFVVWLPARGKQDALAQKLLDAHVARQQARRLLEEAKRRVEEMVLGG